VLPETLHVVNNSKQTASVQRVGAPFSVGRSGNPKGRPKGAVNKLTQAVKERLLAKDGETPLECLLALMRAPEPVRGPKESLSSYNARLKLWYHYRFEAAKAAAPYVHPRLQAVEPPGKDGKPTVMEHRFNIVFVKPGAKDAQPQTPGLLQ